MSSTVAKALSLLDLFSERRPHAGLSDIARLAGIDKATTHRLLAALAHHGLVEQDQASRQYRLGAAVLRLARIREATYPDTALILPILERLSAETGETAHASLFAGNRLATIGVVESARSSRVSLTPSEELPLHATASGIAFLAYQSEDAITRHLAAPLAAITTHTITDAAVIRKEIAAARRNGFATADQTLEFDVFGIAAPLFDGDGFSRGAIAVATPRHRITPALRTAIAEAVVAAAGEASRKLGGAPPESFLRPGRAA